jgi:hypothetical protein
MNKLKVYSLIAAVSALLAITTPASAGTLTVTSGPTFTPDAAFTNNTIKVETLHNPPNVTGDLVKISGDATITPPASNSATVDIAGNYSANAGEIVSAAYSFTIDLNVSRQVTYTVRGSATVLGSPRNFNKTETVLPGLHQYSGTIQAPTSFPFSTSGTFTGTLSLDFGAPASNATALSAAPGTLNVSIQQTGFQLASTAATTPPPSRALNISTRLAVATGDNVLIGGFIITGTDPKKVIIRGMGPSLTGAGVTLSDPTLELHQGNTTLATNDNWKINDQTQQSQEADIRATTIQPNNDLESALIATLSPGNYTAILAGKNGGTGAGLVEVYDLAQAANSQLANISTRGFVQTGDNVMIGGFILGPNSNGASSIVVRAIGPSLASSVANPLQDPTLELRSGDGTLIASNDNWVDGSDKQTIMDKGLAPTNDKESALLAIPPPGNYTAIVRGVNSTTGVAVVEAYNLQ